MNCYSVEKANYLMVQKSLLPPGACCSLSNKLADFIYSHEWQNYLKVTVTNEKNSLWIVSRVRGKWILKLVTIFFILLMKTDCLRSFQMLILATLLWKTLSLYQFTLNFVGERNMLGRGRTLSPLSGFRVTIEKHVPVGIFCTNIFSFVVGSISDSELCR